MTGIRRGASVFTIVILLSIAGALPRAQVPTRDAAGAPGAAQTGTAVVSGVVMSDESPSRPLRRVTVSLVSGDLRVPRSTVTDDNGRFAFSGLVAGNYGVTASKPAYVGAFYGSTRPGRGPGVPLAVRDGQRLTGVTLKMIRGGVITGTLRLPSGQPAQGMTVVAVEVETVGVERRLRLTGGRVVTDDRGEYRVYGLPPGDYLVQAQPSGLLAGALTGVNDAPETTSAEVSWAQQTAPRAGSPGAVAPPVGAAPEHGRTKHYAAVYYPGTANPSDATLVSLGRGEERGGFDFAMALVPTGKLSGVVLGQDGRPQPNAQVTLAVRQDALNVVSLLAPRAAVKSGPDGSFALPAVAPGRYRLSARSASSPAGAAAGAGADLWALQDLEVDGRDISNLTLSMQAGMTVSGRLVFDTSSLPPPTADELSRARVTFVPMVTGSAATDAIVSGASGITASVAADGTFTASGLTPDTYRVSFAVAGLRLSPTASGGGWFLRTVTVRGADVADRTLEIRPRERVDGLVATFTDRPTELAGTLTDQANRAVSAYPIVVFSTDRRDWTAGSRRVVEARPSTAGRFQLVGLPAGTYYLCAVVDLDPGALDDPSFLEQLVPAAVTITLADGVRTVQDLRLAGGMQ